MHRIKRNSLQVLTHLAALSPLALIIRDFATDNLTANPIEDIQLRTGRSALVLLVLALAVTPVKRIFGLRWILELRRPLGLYAFTYASLHFLNFVGLDFGFKPALIREGVLEKPYALVGFAAFLLLLPLAVTSTRGWRRRLGWKWQQLHWLVYLTALLAVGHFWLQVKADYRQPLYYGLVVLILLAVRLPFIRKLAGRLKRQGLNPPP